MDNMNNFENNNNDFSNQEAVQEVSQETVQQVSPEPEKQTNGMAIAGMILGIASIPGSCCFALIGVLLGIMGLVFSILAQRKEKTKMGMAGLICSIIGVVFGVVNMILGFVLAASGATLNILQNM